MYFSRISWNFDPRKPTRHLKLHPVSFLILVVGLVPILAGIFWLVFSSFVSFYQSTSLFVFEKYHRLLKHQVESMYREVNTLSDKYSRIQQDEKNLRLSLGLGRDPNAIPINLSPIGPEQIFYENLNPISSKLTSVVEKTKYLEEAQENTRIELFNLGRYFEIKKNQWSRTPLAKPAEGKITSHFGIRLHPILGSFIFHSGMDISNSQGTPIFSSAKGRILEASFHGTYGYFVEIGHGNGFMTKYAHLSKILVKRGDLVDRFDLIGQMGNTGRSTGTHLHYEIIKNRAPRDPRQYMLPPGVLVD